MSRIAGRLRALEILRVLILGKRRRKDMPRTRRSSARRCRCFARPRETMLARRLSGVMGQMLDFCPQGVKPWIRVHDNYEVNVAAAQKDLDSILAMWKQMLRLQK